MVGGRRVPALYAGESALIGSVLFVDTSANRALPACVAWIDWNKRNTGKSRLVGCELSELSERPIVQSRPLRASGLNTHTDASEVFNGYPSVQALRLCDDCLADSVVRYGLKPALLARDLLKATLGRFGSATLQTGSAARVLGSHSLNLGAAVGSPIAVNGKVYDSEIDAKDVFDSSFFRIWNIADTSEIPLAANKHQIYFAFAIGQQRALSLSTDAVNLLAPRERPDAYLAVADKAKNSVVERLSGKTPKTVLRILVGFVRVGNLGNASNNNLCTKAIHFADISISQLVKVILLKLFFSETARGDVIARLIAALKRLPQQAFLFWRRQQLDVRYKFHLSYMERFVYSVNTKIKKPLSPPA